jgi:hypothetical protein
MREVGMSESSRWSTEVPREITRRYGVESLHSAALAPAEWRPKRDTVISLGLPECELQLTLWNGGEPVAMVRRMRDPNMSVALARVAAVAQARAPAMVMLQCDTKAQLKRALRVLEARLPDHQRVALERLMHGATAPH